MKNILLAVVVAALPTWAAAAEQSRPQPKKPSATLPTANPCAAYGAGFVKVEGSSTCIKIGGSVTVEVGGRVGR